MPCAPKTATVTLGTRARVRLRTEQSDSLKEVSLFQGCDHQQHRSFDDRLGTAARFNRHCSRQCLFQLYSDGVTQSWCGTNLDHDVLAGGYGSGPLTSSCTTASQVTALVPHSSRSCDFIYSTNDLSFQSKVAVFADLNYSDFMSQYTGYKFGIVWSDSKHSGTHEYIGEPVDFFEPTAFLHGGSQALCADALRDGGIFLPRSLLSAAWVVKSHWRRSPSLTQARACASCLRCPLHFSCFESDALHSAPLVCTAATVSSTRHQCSYWSKASSTFPLSACLTSRAGQQPFSDARGGYFVYVRCSCQFAQTAPCPSTSIKTGSQSCAAVSF